VRKWADIPLLPIILLLFVRLISLMALPLEGLRGYGDFVHFYQMAGMGWPFFDYWVEFPPIFPLLSAVLFRLGGGQEHIYDYLLAFVLLFSDASALAVFTRLTLRLHGESEGTPRLWMYCAMLAGLAYSWWYFDSLAVLALLLGLNWLLEGREGRAGLAWALGTLTKFFPVLGLAAAWRFRSPRRAALLTLITLSVTVAVWGGLILASPKMTLASLRSQASKGSWETVWALLDGNLHTGNFGPEIERYQANSALLPRGNPPRLSPWLTLPAFAGIGGYFFWRAKLRTDTAVVAFLGLTWCLFLLWSPGYSPQWVLYLLPLILLALPRRFAALMAFTLILVNLLEWPLLLSRGLFWSLWVIVPLRTALIGLLALAFAKAIPRQGSLLPNTR
jgi:hypothetical protein